MPETAANRQSNPIGSSRISKLNSGGSNDVSPALVGSALLSFPHDGLHATARTMMPAPATRRTIAAVKTDSASVPANGDASVRFEEPAAETPTRTADIRHPPSRSSTGLPPPPQCAEACSCATFTDTEAYEFADVVFTGTLVEINTPVGDIVVSTDPERFVFDVDQVFKGEARTRQSVVTAREGASCGLEISGLGPFVVFARLDDDGITSGAVDGEVYSSLCSGTRPLADGAMPTSFGTTSPPATVAATGGASSSPASSANGNSAPGLRIAAITGVLVLGAGSALALRRRRPKGATSSRTGG